MNLTQSSHHVSLNSLFFFTRKLWEPKENGSDTILIFLQNCIRKCLKFRNIFFRCNIPGEFEKEFRIWTTLKIILIRKRSEFAKDLFS